MLEIEPGKLYAFRTGNLYECVEKTSTDYTTKYHFKGVISNRMIIISGQTPLLQTVRGEATGEDIMRYIKEEEATVNKLQSYIDQCDSNVDILEDWMRRVG